MTIGAVLPAPAGLVAVEDDPDVLLVCVTWNSAEIVLPFLAALPAATAGGGTLRVLLVDNASADGTSRLVRDRAPWVEVIDSGGNLGYAGGINVALRAVRPRQAVLVLNPDAVPQPGMLKALLDGLRQHGAGIVVPRVLDAQGQMKFNLRREPTLARAVGEALLGGHRAARRERWGDMIRDPAAYVDGARADWATGAAMLLAREVVERVGLWSEEFFLYSEETDYALRARDAGFELRLVPSACVVHPGGDMSRSPFLWAILARNRVRLYRRRHGRVATGAYWCAVLLNEGARAVAGRQTHRAAVRALLTGRLPASV